jgi:hypothetical protein
MLVPEIVRWSNGRGHDEKVFTPGAAMSTLPPFENDATLRASVSAPTDITVGEFAGAPVGRMVAGRLLSLPAAAMMRRPRPRALAPALVYAGCTPIEAPRDIEIT